VAQKKSYSRYFIILQEDENGYSLASDKLPSGYTKLETKNDKCKVSYYVQNLKKEKEPYYMVLVCNKKDTKKIIKVGIMNIDEYGRAEVNYEYAIDNIAGSKIPAEAITGAAVVKLLDSNIISVMSGFTSSEIPRGWKSYDILENVVAEEIKEEPKEEPKINLDIQVSEEVRIADMIGKEEKNIFAEYEQKIEEIKALEADRSNELNEDNTEGNDEEEKDDKEFDESRILQEKQCIENSFNDKELQENSEEKSSENIENDKNNLNKQTYYENDLYREEKNFPVGTVGEFFRLVAEDFEEVNDSCREIKKCRWYKIAVNSLDDMCNSSNYNRYTIAYYPMISYYPYIKKYGHYLLGYKYDSKGRMKYLVYGVPGTKAKSEQPYSGKSGFVTWVPNKIGDERDESFGYWLMFYDFRNSTIVIPIK
jgi:hypothetical protein